MRLWLSKNSAVPIQEQLVTQLILGIVSGDLKGGERLASSTEIARRFHVHANTVRGSYRELVERGWLDWRAGSGFYVRHLEAQPRLDPALDLDHLIATFLNVARGRGHSLEEIQSRIQRWFSRQRPDRIVVIEPEPELRKILVAEIASWAEVPVAGMSFDDASVAGRLPGGLAVALVDHAGDVLAKLPSEVPRVLLRSRSVTKSLAGEVRPNPDTLITIVSGWPLFLQWARTTLVAVGLDPNALELRDSRRKGWNRGLTARSFIVCDSLAARELPPGCKPRIFKLISDESAEELRATLTQE